MRVLWLIWIYITQWYVLDGHFIKCQTVYIRAQVKIQVCEIGSGWVWIKTVINSLSHCKWDVLYHRYGRGIMGNEFRVILMILLSYSIMWSRMKKLKLCEMRSFSLAPSHSCCPSCAELLTLGQAVKELTADMTFSLSFISCQPVERFFLFLESSDVSQKMN